MLDQHWPFHIKLSLMKHIVKALNKDRDWFVYICAAFPGLSNEKKKAGAFNNVWHAFTKVTQNFLANKRSHNYIQLVNDLLDKLYKLNINMSIKVYFSFSYLHSFPENVGAFRSMIGLKVIEMRYQGHWNAHIMADRCWSLMRDCVGIKHSRQSKKICVKGRMKCVKTDIRFWTFWLLLCVSVYIFGDYLSGVLISPTEPVL